MPKITDIKASCATTSNPDDHRVRVFIDGEYCTSIRARTFKGMQENEGIDIGSDISCQALKDKDNFYWKQAYGKDSWEKEKVRLNKVKLFVEAVSSDIEVFTVGFGADSDAFIERHPEMAGAPDLEVRVRNEDLILLLIEVTGTEAMRGDPTCYWVRPDKLKYASMHPDEDIWVILHYSKPVEKFVFIKPTHGKTYKYVSVSIRGAGERMVEFRDSDPEVKSEYEFRAHLLGKVADATGGTRALVTKLGAEAFVNVYVASYLGAYAAINGGDAVEEKPLKKALNLAIASWEKLNTLITECQAKNAAPPQDVPLAAALSSTADMRHNKTLCSDCLRPIPPQQYRHDKERCWNCRQKKVSPHGS